MKITGILTLLLCMTFYTYTQNQHIIIGQGGGFTGKTTQYQIFPDGKVLKGSGLTEINYSYTGKIKKCTAGKYFKKAADVSESSFSHPGNIYYFISFVRDGKEIKYTWGKPGYEIPGDIANLYNEINKKISGIDFHPVTD